MSTGKLTATVFIAGPEDKLGVVDVYEEASPGIVNSYQEQFHNVMDSLDNFLSGVSGLAKGIKSGMDFINSNLNAIGGAIKSAFGMVNNVVGNVIGAVKGVVNGVKGAINGVIGTVNGVINTVAGAINTGIGVLNGIISIPSRIMSGILGGGGALAANFLNVYNNVKNLFNAKVDFRGVVAIGRVSDRLSGGLNNQYRNKAVSNQSISLQEALGRSIANYGSLNPSSNTLSSSINNDLDYILGGDRAAITSITKPALNRATSLNEPTTYDKKNSSLSVDRLISNITDPDLTSAIMDLTPEAQSIFVKGLSEQQTFTNNKITVAGNAAVISPQVSIQNKEAIANIINTITDGNYEVKSKNDGVETNVIAGVVHLASKAGFPKPFETIAKCKSPEIMIEIAKPLLRRAVEEGDFELIRDIANTAVVKEIPVIIPNLISEIKARLKKPENLTQQEYSRYYKLVKGIFNDINPTWTRFKSGKIDAVDATGVAENPFFADLIEAQLNELKSPDCNLSNLQIAYPLDGLNNPTKLLNEIGLGEPTVVIDSEGVETIIPPDRYAKVEVLKIDPKNYKDEPFLLLGKVFLTSSVDSEIKKHFPYFYETLTNTPVMPIM